MAIETLEKRIESKKKAIEKCEKKVARIEKAKASGLGKQFLLITTKATLEYTLRDLEDDKMERNSQ